MKQVTKYEADDGTLFDFEHQAQDYEHRQQCVDDILRTWDNFDIFADNAQEMARIIVDAYTLTKKL